MDINHYILKLKKICIETEEPEILLKELTGNLDSLREIYKKNKELFSEEEVRYLSELKEMSKELSLLFETIEESENMRSLDDGKDILQKLKFFVEYFSGTGIVPFIRRKLLVVREDVARLPSIAEIKEKERFNRSIIKLSEKPPICKKCNIPLELKKGENEYFWGCRNFPSCFYKKWLTEKEKLFLYSKQEHSMSR